MLGAPATLIFLVHRADGQLFVFAVPGGYERSEVVGGDGGEHRLELPALFGRSLMRFFRHFITT